MKEGPWHSGGFFQQLSGAREDYLALTKPSECPLFQKLLPEVAREAGRESELGAPEFAAEMWAALSSRRELLFKGARPAISRWYSWVDCHKVWSKVSSLHFLVFLIWGMGSDLLKKNSSAASLQLCAPGASTDDSKKETMRDQHQKAGRLRAKGRSLLHVSLLVLQNVNVRRKAEVVYQSLQAMRSFPYCLVGVVSLLLRVDPLQCADCINWSICFSHRHLCLNNMRVPLVTNQGSEINLRLSYATRIPIDYGSTCA